VAPTPHHDDGDDDELDGGDDDDDWMVANRTEMAIADPRPRPAVPARPEPQA